MLFNFLLIFGSFCYFLALLWILRAKDSEKESQTSAKRAEDAAKDSKKAAKRAENAEKKINDILKKAEDDEKKYKEAEKRAKNAEKKSKEAEKKAEDAEKKSKEAEEKAEDAEKKSKEAERKAEDFEKKFIEAQKRVDNAEKKSKDAEKRVEEAEKKSKDTEKRAEEIKKREEEAKKKKDEKKKAGEVVMLPYKYEEIQLDDNIVGIYLKQKSQIYYTDANGRNCFMVFANSFTIVNDRASDEWVRVPDSISGSWYFSGYATNRLNWRLIYNDFRVDLCNPEIIYEVVFHFMLGDNLFERGPAYRGTIRFSLTHANNKSDSKELVLSNMKTDEWFEIHMGEFKAPPKESTTISTIRFTIDDYDRSEYKQGLLIKGVVIRPKA